jgi:hypothetical protein
MRTVLSSRNVVRPLRNVVPNSLVNPSLKNVITALACMENPALSIILVLQVFLVE